MGYGGPGSSAIVLTAHANGAAEDQSIAIAAWKSTARAECQLNLLRELKKANLGLAEIENFIESLEGAKKSKFKKKDTERDEDLIKRIMARKISDAECVLREAEAEKNKLRKKIQKKHGKNSRESRKIVKMLRREALVVKREVKDKHKEKIQHLSKKYKEKPRQKKMIIPKELERYKNVSILSDKIVESEEDTKNAVTNDVEILVIGTEVDSDFFSYLPSTQFSNNST